MGRRKIREIFSKLEVARLIYHFLRNSLNLVNDKFNFIQGSFRGNGVNVYWRRNVKNFGDFLTPYLLSRYGLRAVYTPAENATLLSVGSILGDISGSFSGYILGSGLIEDCFHPLPNAKILAVRGELTRTRIGAPEGTPLGDPGLLVSNFFCKDAISLKFRLGIVPHYVDYNHEKVRKLAEKFTRKILIINVRKRPSSVFRDICQCETILSSSLHGLVVAQSFGIPSRWINISGRVYGDGFKFRDYYSSLSISDPKSYELTGEEDLKELLNAVRDVPYDNVEKVKRKLNELFCNLKHEILR